MNDDVQDDFEELLAARARMLRSNTVTLHRIAHVFDEDPPAPPDWPAKDLGFNMTDADDSLVEEALRRARERANEPMSTPESIADGEEFLKEARLASIAALRRRIESGELISAAALQVRLNVSAESIDSAVREGRLFACVDPDGVNYYPAFYADPYHNRWKIETVCLRLAGLHPTVKHHFFTSKAFSLGSKTPLQALAEGRLDDVLRAATAYVER